MDTVPVHVVLRAVYCVPVLSQVIILILHLYLEKLNSFKLFFQVLHPYTMRYHRRYRRSTYVGLQSNVFDPGSRCLRQIDRPAGRRDYCPILRILLPGLANGRALGKFDLFSW